MMEFPKYFYFRVKPNRHGTDIEIEDASGADVVEVVRCNQCKHYEGIHDVPGCAPCAFWGIGGVMWDDFCKRGERYDSD